MAIETFKRCMILALLIFNTAFGLYIANKQMSRMRTQKEK
jgi:hypothetical protein